MAELDKNTQEEIMRDLILGIERDGKAIARRLAKRKFCEDTILKDALQFITKPELKDIGKRYGIENLHKLRKQELVDSLVIAIPANATHVINYMNLEHYAIFRGYEESKGSCIPESVEAKIFLEEAGLVFDFFHEGELATFIPSDIQSLYMKLFNDEANMKRTEMNSMLIATIDVFTSYYGVLKSEQFYDMLMGDDFLEGFSVFERWLVANQEYFACAEIQDGFIYYYLCSDYEAVYEEAQSQTNRAYREIGTNDFEKFLREDMIWTDSHNRFVKLCDELLGIDRLEAIDIIEHIILMINYGYSLTEIYDEVFGQLRKLSLKHSKKLIEAISSLYRNSPLWILKGWSPNEIANDKIVAFRKPDKVGRNDPCPCGSGKKYKKCCLNKPK